jgi:hypothetical protein
MFSMPAGVRRRTTSTSGAQQEALGSVDTQQANESHNRFSENLDQINITPRITKIFNQREEEARIPLSLSKKNI